MSYLNDIHDMLLNEMPDGADHDTANCVICNNGNINNNIDHNSEEGGDMKTYTEDEFTAAVAEAVAPLQAELEAIRTSQAQEEIEAHVAEAVITAEAKILELQAELDKAELRVAEAEKSRDEIVAWLEGEVEAAEEAARLETLRTERLSAIKEVASFGDEYIEANLDRWVAMDDEVFASVLEDWKAVSTATRQVEAEVDTDTEEVEAEIPAETAMNNIRTADETSVARDVINARLRGIDVRNI